MKIIMLSTLAAMATIFVGAFFGCTAKQPASSGILKGKFAPCPKSPNCVSSMSTDPKHAIDPLVYSTDKAHALSVLKTALATEKRAEIVLEKDNYLHVEFKSKLFRFVDDVEFYFPENEKLIHIRSASRTGYSDLGVNRKRMEAIREKFTRALEQT